MARVLLLLALRPLLSLFLCLCRGPLSLLCGIAVCGRPRIEGRRGRCHGRIRTRLWGWPLGLFALGLRRASGVEEWTRWFRLCRWIAARLIGLPCLRALSRLSLPGNRWGGWWRGRGGCSWCDRGRF